MTTSRLEAFSDGVIAIIITLLVLEIHLPEAGEALDWGLVIGLLPQVAIFALSFVIIGTYWAAHHIFFSFATRADRWLIWLNLALLFAIALIPLATGLLAGHPRDPVAVDLYAIVLSLANCAGTAVFLYVTRRTGREGGAMAAGHRAGIAAVHMAPVLVYAVAAVIAPVSPPATLVLFAAVPAFFIFGHPLLSPMIERARG
ncbi:TMEM175 family protein [Rhizobium halophytocola]|uniref:Membrane protein n=1 Tax=Rhizobium halophytocola TaxID=735519 RepID=A0ABS4DVS5_9HYPH|nr:putative membrane protein [Rhizobium halophytocola]